MVVKRGSHWPRGGIENSRTRRTREHSNERDAKGRGRERWGVPTGVRQMGSSVVLCCVLCG